MVDEWGVLIHLSVQAADSSSRCSSVPEQMPACSLVHAAEVGAGNVSPCRMACLPLLLFAQAGGRSSRHHCDAMQAAAAVARTRTHQLAFALPSHAAAACCEDTLLLLQNKARCCNVQNVLNMYVRGLMPESPLSPASACRLTMP